MEIKRVANRLAERVPRGKNGNLLDLVELLNLDKYHLEMAPGGEKRIENVTFRKEGLNPHRKADAIQKIGPREMMKREDEFRDEDDLESLLISTSVIE